MCTVSWLHYRDSGRSGYELFCNRDEKRTRPAAESPATHERNGVSYMAPLDVEAGGSWIAVNEFAVSLCLLNAGSTPGKMSRGLLIPELIDSQTLDQVATKVSQMDLTSYAPFTLLALDAGRPAMVIEWDGVSQKLIPDAESLMPLTSSSFDTERVRQTRLETFDRLRQKAGRVDTALLFDFHQNHGEGPSAYSTCMHREDAATVSFSWIKVENGSAEFFYAPGATCEFADELRGLQRIA